MTEFKLYQKKIFNNFDYKLGVDKKFITNFFQKKMSEFYPEVKSVIKVSTKVSSRYGGQTVLIKYTIDTINIDGKKNKHYIYGKFYKEWPLSYNYYYLDLLYSNGFAGPNYFCQRPLFYFEKINLLLYEQLDGVFLFEMMEQGISKKELRNKIIASVKLLKKMHSTKLTRPKKELVGGISRSYTWINVIKVFYKYYPKREGIVDNMFQAYYSLKQKYSKKSYKTIIHNDFTQYNVIFKDNNPGIIDMNNAYLGDPAVDVASFIVQLLYGVLSLDKRFSVKEIKSLKNLIINTYTTDREKDDFFKRVEVFSVKYILNNMAHVLRFGDLKTKKAKIENVEYYLKLADDILYNLLKK